MPLKQQTKVLGRSDRETPTSVQLEKSTRRRLAQAAKKHERSVSFLLRKAIEQYLDSLDQQVQPSE